MLYMSKDFVIIFSWVSNNISIPNNPINVQSKSNKWERSKSCYRGEAFMQETLDVIRNMCLKYKAQEKNIINIAVT